MGANRIKSNLIKFTFLEGHVWILEDDGQEKLEGEQ